MFTKKNIQVLLKEVDKCLNPATKRPTTPEDECNNMLIMGNCPIKFLRVFSNDTYFKSRYSQFILKKKVISVSFNSYCAYY